MGVYLYSRLPSTYQEVEYIQSSGSAGTGQFIRTGFKANQNTAVEMSISADNVTNNACFYCSRTGGSTATFTCFRIGNKLRHDYNTTQQSDVYTISANTIYKIYANKNLFYVNDTLVDTRTAGTFQSSYAMLLLASNNGGDNVSIDNCFSGKLYYCKIWDGGTLVRDFIPCYRKLDNVIGLYDLVNDTFYTNSGTGTFSKGADVDINHKHPLKNAYIGGYYEYSYDFRNKSSTILTNDGWSFTEGSSNSACTSDGLHLTSSSQNIRIRHAIGKDLTNAKKITIIQNKILASAASVRLSLTPNQSVTNHSGITSDSNQNKQTLAISGTDYNYSGLSAGTYEQKGVFDLVNKTATLYCTGKTEHIENMTDSQIALIKTKTHLNGYIWNSSSTNTYIQDISLIIEY